MVFDPERWETTGPGVARGPTAKPDPGTRAPSARGACPPRLSGTIAQVADTVRYVYILVCADASYGGRAANPAARVDAQNEGRGAACTFKRRPVRRLPAALGSWQVDFTAEMVERAYVLG